MKSALKSFGASALGIGASIILGILVVRGLDWGEVLNSFQGVSMPLVALAVAVFMAASVLRAVRWQLLFTEKRVSTMRLFIVQNEGIGLNNLVPVRIASEAVQLAVLTLRDGVRFTTALATLGMERVLDLVASATILAVAFFFVPQMSRFAPVIVGLVLVTLVAVAAVTVVAWGGDANVILRRFPFLADSLTNLSRSVRDLGRSPLRVAGASALSFVCWGMVGLTAWLIALALEIDGQISLNIATLVILSAIFFATSVPGAPSAIGTFEFAVVYVLGFFGMEKESAFGFAVVTHVVFFLPSTIIAALFLPREGLGSMRTVRQTLFKGAKAGDETRV